MDGLDPQSVAYTPAHPFSEFFPPPYRVLLLVSLGVFCWGLNIHGLSLLGIDTAEIAGDSGSPHRSRPRDRNGADLPLHSPALGLNGHGDNDGRDYLHARSTTRKRAVSVTDISTVVSTAPKDVYSIAIAVAAWTCLNWLFFRTYVNSWGGDSRGRHAQVFQGIAVLGVFIAGIWPYNHLWKASRRQFAAALLSLFLPSKLIMRPPTFSAILLADILTSFGKVFGDVWLTACFLVPRKEHHTWWNGRGSWAVPFLVSLPSAIRLIQCLAEYHGTSARPAPDSNAALVIPGGKVVKSKRPLANALKYASAFPVIWISASESARAGGVPDEQSQSSLWTLWLLSVLVNSLFSFWWDVTNDWGLEGLKPSTWSDNYSISAFWSFAPMGLSKSLHRRGLSTWPAPRNDEDEGREGLLSSTSGTDAVDSGYKPQHNHASERTTGGSFAPFARTLTARVLRPTPSLTWRSSAPASTLPSESMMFPPTVYLTAALVDLVLRFTWSLKLSPHLAQLVELESGVFCLEIAEILRRCGWVFLRVEWETVKRQRAAEIIRDRTELQASSFDGEDGPSNTRVDIGAGSLVR